MKRRSRKRSSTASTLLNHNPSGHLKGAVFDKEELEERNRLIKIEYDAGLGYRTIGLRYGISASRVRAILFPETKRILTVKPYEKTRRKRLAAGTLPIFNGSSVDDFHRLLGEARISQRRLARHLGFAEHTVNNYASGKIPMPTYIRRYLELLAFVQKKLKLQRSLRLEDMGKYDD